MLDGVVVGIVVDNVDELKSHRILVEYPVDSDDEVQSAWCRMITPMAGLDRGMVMIPDIGTEVVLGFAYRSLTPFVLGALYNPKEDLPVYANEDEDNNLRVFWSRNDHMVLFDDTDGAERVAIAAQTTEYCDPEKGVIYQVADAANKTLTEYCGGDTEWQAVKTISIKCRDFELDATASIDISGTVSVDAAAGRSASIESAANQVYQGLVVHVNPIIGPAKPEGADPLPDYKHPPTS